MSAAGMTGNSRGRTTAELNRLRRAGDSLPDQSHREQPNEDQCEGARLWNRGGPHVSDTLAEHEGVFRSDIRPEREHGVDERKSKSDCAVREAVRDGSIGDESHPIPLIRSQHETVGVVKR